ncbi:MAG: NADH-quinone oxidoreductase subunit M [Chloroflexaceae bacterium]|jgi:NADH-quinone oxidoreductase subunit M|nr:NADH-quinone oxidoreductase subunit M [Chloroflexaceae bacterium]
MTSFPLLSIVLWLPALGALLLLLLPRNRDALYRQVGLMFTVATFVVSLGLLVSFSTPAGAAASAAAPPTMRLLEQLPWIPAWGVGYSIGLDGVSLWLVLLTTLLTPIAAWASWNSITTQVRYFQVLLLLLETALIGVFVSVDLFLFYIFWEFTLIPMALMIGIWGGANRMAAAMKFFLYTFAASLLMLLSIIGVYALHRSAIGATQPGFGGTFDLLRIVADLRSGAFALDGNLARLLFGGFLAAFAVKAPIWPFHSWLPDAYSEAPTPVVILLSAVMSKLGTYGLVRFNLTLFPEAAGWAAPAVAVLAVIGILYGAMVAYAQSDMKRLVAYSSLSHMGFVVLGIFALNGLGVSGAVLQMVNHGLTTAALFLIVGMLESRRGSRDLAAFGGLWQATPVLGGLTLLVVLSSAGLPGLNGFVGEFTIMQGAYSSPTLGWPFLAFAVLGVVLAVVYLLRMFRSAFMGDTLAETASLRDLNRQELAVLVLLCLPMVAIGLFPNLLLVSVEEGVAGVMRGILVAVASR